MLPGASWHLRDKWSNTALHYAKQRNHSNIVNALEAAGNPENTMWCQHTSPSETMLKLLVIAVPFVILVSIVDNATSMEYLYFIFVL